MPFLLAAVLVTMFHFQSTVRAEGKKDEIKKKVVEIVVEVLGVDEAWVTEDVSLIDDLGADVDKPFEIYKAIEDKFEIEIPEEVELKFLTVGDVINYIVRHKK
jgi:acyl carrier protein